MKLFLKLIGLIFLTTPINYCIINCCENRYVELAFIVSLAIGMCFIQFKFED